MAEKGANGEIYNIGSEEEVSIKDLIFKIGEILEIKLNLNQGKILPGGTSRRCPDISKIKKIDFSNKNDLMTGLKKTVNWYKNKLIEDNNV